MAQANQADFLGEGTATSAQAPALSAAQKQAAEDARRQRILKASAAQTAATNARAGGYNDQRAKANALTQFANNTSEVIRRYEQGLPGPDGKAITRAQYDAAKALQKGNQEAMNSTGYKLLTGGILAAPGLVTGAGALAGGLASGGAGSLVGGSTGAVGLPAQSAPFLTASPYAAGAGSTLAAAGGAPAAAGAAAAAGGGLSAGQIASGVIGAAGLLSSGAGLAGKLTQDPIKGAPLQPVPQATQDQIAATRAQGGNYSSQINAAAQRAMAVADSYTAQPTSAVQQKRQTLQAAGAPSGAPPESAYLSQSALASRPQRSTTTTPSAFQAANSQYLNFTPPSDTLSGLPDYGAQAQTYQNRAAPQITETGGGKAAQQQALSAVQSYRPDTSGIGAIENARADTSGAQALQNFSTAQSEGVAGQLMNFDTSAIRQGANDLMGFQTTGANEAAAGLRGFDPQNPAIRQLQEFQTDRQGIRDLQAYAAQAEGPSKAQALLNSQADQDIRTQLAIARSARGGPAAVAAAQRQAQSEGAAIQAETRGQAAALRAQETDTYQQRRLGALTAAGQLIAQDSAQKIQQLQSSGALISDQNAQILQSKVALGQVLSAADAQKLSAYQSAVQAITQASAQNLAAQQAAGGLYAQAEQTRATAAAQAANILLQGSAINQQGAIAAQNARATASGQALQALSIQGQISSDIRNADISVLQSNLSAQLQQLNLNDTQVRAFSQMALDKQVASQNAQLQAAQLGLNAAQVQSAIDLGWQQFAQSQLTDAQNFQLAQQAQANGVYVANQNAQTERNNALINFGGTALSAAAAGFRR